jgi:hypothetical protein
MNQKTNIHIRSLSDEFYSRSPNTQEMIKGWSSNTTPTSSHKNIVVVNDDVEIIKYFSSLDTIEQNLMIQYGMISPMQITMLNKKQK